MYLVNLFMLRKNRSANIAKKRLKIIVTEQRLENHCIPQYLPQLKQDIIKVICKYVKINSETISIQFETNNKNKHILELNIILNESKK